MRGPHGITGDALRGNLIATSAFDGVIKAADNDTSGDEHGDEEPEQQSTGMQGRPDSAIQDAMIRLQVGRGAESHDPEDRCHRSLTWSQDGACHEDFHMLPHRARKDRCKNANGTGKAIGKVSMAILSVEENTGLHCRSIVTQVVING
jgi:hypothetical protein